MKTYAWLHGAQKYLKEVTGVQSIGMCHLEDRGLVEFKIATRYMHMATLSIREKLGLSDDSYTFERAAHYIMDKFDLGSGRRIELQYTFGAQHAVVRLIDDAEPLDDLGGQT